MIRMCGGPVREPCFAMRPRSSGLARRTARFQEQSLLDDKLFICLYRATFLQEKYVRLSPPATAGVRSQGTRRTVRSASRLSRARTMACGDAGLWSLSTQRSVGRSVVYATMLARTLVGQNRSVSLACRCDETHTHSHGCMGPLGSSVQRGDGGLYKLCTASASAEDVSGSFVDAAFDSPLGILMPKALASRL